MSARTWVILGATSIIAKEFAHLAAGAQQNVLLVGRDLRQLELIACDIRLRYHVRCDVLNVDFALDKQAFLDVFQHSSEEMDLYVGQSVMLDNNQLTNDAIEALIQVNILNTIQWIEAYWQKKQSQHRLLYVSSVAACRGRAKNSLYGASKAAVEIYLQGVQQSAHKNQHITIARLGYIDTHTTYGLPGIFYASKPKACAKACWQALLANKPTLYHPFFWRFIMQLIRHTPMCLYKKMGSL